MELGHTFLRFFLTPSLKDLSHFDPYIQVILRCHLSGASFVIATGRPDFVGRCQEQVNTPHEIMKRITAQLS